MRVLAESVTVTFNTVQEIAGQRASRIRQFVVQPAHDSAHDEILISFVRLSQQSVTEIAQALRTRRGVASVENAEGQL